MLELNYVTRWNSESWFMNQVFEHKIYVATKHIQTSHKWKATTLNRNKSNDVKCAKVGVCVCVLFFLWCTFVGISERNGKCKIPLILNEILWLWNSILSGKKLCSSSIFDTLMLAFHISNVYNTLREKYYVWLEQFINPSVLIETKAKKKTKSNQKHIASSAQNRLTILSWH